MSGEKGEGTPDGPADPAAGGRGEKERREGAGGRGEKERREGRERDVTQLHATNFLLPRIKFGS